jgi:hypothetical protein
VLSVVSKELGLCQCALRVNDLPLFSIDALTLDRIHHPQVDLQHRFGRPLELPWFYFLTCDGNFRVYQELTIFI